MSISKTKKLFLILTLLFLTVSPVLGDGLVPCSGFDCTVSHFLKMITDVFDFIVLQVVPVIAVIGFVVAGLIMMTSGGEPGKFNQGKTAMIAIAIGLLVVYLAWALIKLFIDVIGGAEWTKTFFK